MMGSEPLLLLDEELELLELLEELELELDEELLLEELEPELLLELDDELAQAQSLVRELYPTRCNYNLVQPDK